MSDSSRGGFSDASPRVVTRIETAVECLMGPWAV